MDKKFSREEYNELYAEFEFEEADKNHNGVISKKEELDAHKNAKIGSLLKPIVGETLEEYKKRVIDILNKYSKVTSEHNGKFQKADAKTFSEHGIISIRMKQMFCMMT